MSGFRFTSGKRHLMLSTRVAVASKGTNPGLGGVCKKILMLFIYKTQIRHSAKTYPGYQAGGEIRESEKPEGD